MGERVSLADPQTALTDRAVDLLADGPADAQTLISYVCQLPGAPKHVAEHMAAALFAGHQRFVRDDEGRWRLRDGGSVASRPAARHSMGASISTTLSASPGSPIPAAPPTGAMDELRSTPFVVVDVETTGTSPRGGDRVTEIAAVLVRDGQATTVFDSLINPERPIPPAIMALTNITWEMVQDAPRFADVCDQVLAVLEGNVFVAHNAAFDWRFVAAEIERVTRRRLSGRTLCTVRLARRLVPQQRRRNLDALALYYGFDNVARHRAGGDAWVTAHILMKLLERARDHGCATVDDVDRLLAAGRATVRRPRRPSAMPRPAADDFSA